MKELDEIKIPVWWKRGGMMTRRDCLPFDHPENEYNYIKREYGVEPEDYGVYHPLDEELKYKSREELIAEIAKTRNEIRMMEKLGLF